MHLFTCQACAIRVYSARQDNARTCPRCHTPMTRADLLSGMLRRGRASNTPARRTSRASASGPSGSDLVNETLRRSRSSNTVIRRDGDTLNGGTP